MLSVDNGYYRHYAMRQYLANTLTKRYNASLIGNIPVDTYSSDLEYNEEEIEEKKEKLTARVLI